MSSPVWKGSLKIGDIELAVRLFSGPAAESISLNQLHTCGSPVGQQLYCKAENKVIPRDQVLKGREVSKDRYVRIDEEQLAAITPQRSTTLPLLFIGKDVVDPVFFENTYFLHPDLLDEPAYVALHQALTHLEYVALTKIVVQRERWMLIRPVTGGLVAHPLYYGKEARIISAFRMNTMPTADLQTRMSWEVAGRKSTFDPRQTVDEASNRLSALIEQLAGGIPTEQPPAAAAPGLIPRKRPTARPTARKTRKAA